MGPQNYPDGIIASDPSAPWNQGQNDTEKMTEIRNFAKCGVAEIDELISTLESMKLENPGYFRAMMDCPWNFQEQSLAALGRLKHNLESVVADITERFELGWGLD